MDDLRPGQRQRRTARLYGDQWRTDPAGWPRQLHQWLPARDVSGIDHQAECHGAGQCEAAGEVSAAATGEARPRPSARPGFRGESGGRGKSARRAGERHHQSGARLSDADGGAGLARSVRRIGGHETGLRARGRVQADADFRHRVPAGPPDGGAGRAVRGAHLPIDQRRSLGSAQQAPRGACQQRAGGRPAHRGPDPRSQGPWDARLHPRGLERRIRADAVCPRVGWPRPQPAGVLDVDGWRRREGGHDHRCHRRLRLPGRREEVHDP